MTEPVRESPDVVAQTRKWMLRGAILFLLLVIAFPAYKTVEASRRQSAMDAQLRALETSGKQLYGLNCSACHGTSGQGVDAPALNSQQFFQGTSDEQMHGIIRGGIPGTEMPAWWNEYGGPLTDQQIQAVVTYVRSWAAKAPSNPNWRTPSTTASPSTMASP